MQNRSDEKGLYRTFHAKSNTFKNFVFFFKLCFFILFVYIIPFLGAFELFLMVRLKSSDFSFFTNNFFKNGKYLKFHMSASTRRLKRQLQRWNQTLQNSSMKMDYFCFNKLSTVEKKYFIEVSNLIIWY